MAIILGNLLAFGGRAFSTAPGACGGWGTRLVLSPLTLFPPFQPPVAMSQVRAAIMDFDLFGKDCPSPIKRSPTLREDQEKQVVFKRVVVEKVSTVPHVLVGWGFYKCCGL